MKPKISGEMVKVLRLLLLLSMVPYGIQYKSFCTGTIKTFLFLL